MVRLMSNLKSHVIGHRKLFDLWARLLSRGQLTGSFLFVGPSGVGKKKSAWAMIQQALCERKIQNEACGECGSCRRAEAHQHESVLLIEPDGNLIKVEQAQTILQFLQLKSIGRHRFVLVDEAHRMNAATANSLLKTLEEPTEGTTIIFLAPSLTSVLPTIRSRLRVFHFQPVPLEEIKEARTVPEWALEASLGRFDLLEALGTPEERQFRTTWADFLVKFVTSPDTLTDETWRDALKNKDEFKHALDLWLKMVRDALFLQQGEKKSLLTLDLNPQLQRLATMTTEALQKMGLALIELQKELNFNKDAVLSLESLYIGLEKQHASVGNR
jgi:DNA polymerase-3 subunit delta'